MIDLDDIERACNFLMATCRHNHIPTQMNAEVTKELITRLRQAEKDAARYRWIKENSQFGVGRCGVDWELYFEGPAPDNSEMVERHIDEAMECK